MFVSFSLNFKDSLHETGKHQSCQLSFMPLCRRAGLLELDVGLTSSQAPGWLPGRERDSCPFPSAHGFDPMTRCGRLGNNLNR